ncbi:MAG: hypothetical protein QW117_00715 [Candidatus Pacearchaeota archaeon]
MVEKVNGEEIKNRIIEFLKNNGPSLPIHISKAINLNTLFTSAFLSELSSEKRIKISNLKIGGSPLYYLEENVSMLENFSNYLIGKEKEAFLLLKSNLVLQDNELPPAIRVALRSLKDFAISFTIKIDSQEVLFWRYFKTTEDESIEKAKEIIRKKSIPSTSIVEKGIKSEYTSKESKEEFKEKIIEKEEKKKEEKIIEDTQEKIKRKKDRVIEESTFIKEIKEKLHEANIEIIEQKEIGKKELEAIVRIDSNIGKIMFYCVFKSKKTISEVDLAFYLQKAQGHRLPLLFISDGKLNKKALYYLQEWKTLIKFKELKDLVN